MQGRYGACYTCPPNTDTVAERDVMCESLPGYGLPIGTPSLVTVATPSALAVEGVPRVGVLSLRMPHIVPSTQDYFLCCGQDMQCRLFKKSELDLNQGTVGPGSYFEKCSSSSSLNTSSIVARRLLQQGDGGEIQRCFTSQYNPLRGDNTCYDCPPGGFLFA